MVEAQLFGEDFLPFNFFPNSRLFPSSFFLGNFFPPFFFKPLSCEGLELLSGENWSPLMRGGRVSPSPFSRFLGFPPSSTGGFSLTYRGNGALSEFNPSLKRGQWGGNGGDTPPPGDIFPPEGRGPPLNIGGPVGVPPTEF